jgi:class 3 adenylate cyclase/tetratricopeptide (TPR) repeat protein
MNCPECQFENPEEAKFCIECGHQLAFTHVAHIWDPSSKDLVSHEQFEKIQRYLPKGLAEKILAKKDKIEGERKQVTVMFCDMVGFTPLVEKVGPEESYSIMDQVYEILIHKVQDFEGTVNEMTGDGIMALFGSPIALEDAPQRALRSALSIHREITKFNNQKRLIIPIKMRIGIHTGPVVVGTLGNDLRVEFKAVGDTVNLASRMEGLAEPSTTYVTEDTFKLTQALFRFEALGGREVKGKNKAIPAYKLLSAKDDVYRPRLGLERMIYSKMVGRDKDLDRLELQVMKAINGEGSIVNIIGEAGIGKSRLVAELKKLDVMKKVTLLEGRAISTGRNLGFHPIIHLLKNWAQIREDDSKSAALSKLETAIRRVHPEEIYEVLPFVATLMGMKLSDRYAERVKGIEGEALEKLILKNVRELLTRAAELTPMVIVMEDLHWADLSSIELMEFLFVLTETQRILSINVFRPGHRETGDRIVKTIKEKLPGYGVEIVLQPLDERMSEVLINNMLNIRGFHHTLIDQIVRRSDGNPFFIEEVVRSFIDEGAIVAKEGSFEVTEKIDTMVIPYTINDVLMARIDRLEEETRNLVKIASVIGRSFFFRILTEVARTIEDINSKLSYLKEIQLIRERRRMEELEYLFKHALTQEAAYESILLQRRREIHLEVADAIIEVFNERLPEFYGMLAFHYSKCENLEKAEEYLRKAGEEALKASASIEALNYCQEALKLYLNKHGDSGDPEKIAGLEKYIALALYNRGHHDEAIEYFDRVLEYWGVKRPKNRLIAILILITDSLNVIQNLYFPLKKSKKNPDKKDDEIINLIEKRGLALAQVDTKKMFMDSIGTLKRLNRLDITKTENGVSTYIEYSGMFSFSGISFKISRKILDYTKGYIKNSDIKSMFLHTFFELLHDFLLGNWNRQIGYRGELVDRYLKTGEVFQAAAYIIFSGLLEIEQGNFSEAEALVDKLYRIGEEYNNDYARGTKYYLNSQRLLKLRKLNEALNEADAGISFLNKINQNLFALSVLGIKTKIQFLQGDIEGMEYSLLSDEEPGIREKGVVPFYINNLMRSQFLFDLYMLEESNHGRNRLKKSQLKKKAYRCGKAAVKNSMKYAGNRTEVFRLMGVYYWLIGKQDKSLLWMNKSINVGKQVDALPELGRTYLELGKRLLEPENKLHELNGITAEEFLVQAEQLFAKMNLEWDLAELDKIRSLVKDE